jgi:hypothetical protein
MPNRMVSERIVDVLTWCERDSAAWPAGLRADCAVVHARFEALKLDVDSAEAWRQAQSEFVRRVLHEAGLKRIVYRSR